MSTNSSTSCEDKTPICNWTVENFSKCTEKVLANSFSLSSNGKFKFKLQIFPSQTSDSTNNCTVIRVLKITDTTQNDDEFGYKLTVVNKDLDKCLNQDGQYVSNSSNGGVCFQHINLYRPYLLDVSNGFLVDDKLSIRCEIYGKDNRSGLSPNAENMKTLEAYESLLENSNHSDVVFVVGGKQFKLHKAILTVRSPVFGAMFDHSDLEENKHNLVELIDIEKEVFEVLCHFIYTGNIASLGQHALELFIAADKYQIQSLKSVCEEWLTANLTIETVSNVLTLADMHNATDLKSKCIEYITDNSTKVMITEQWNVMATSRVQLLIELYKHLAMK